MCFKSQADIQELHAAAKDSVYFLGTVWSGTIHFVYVCTVCVLKPILYFVNSHTGNEK